MKLKQHAGGAYPSAAPGLASLVEVHASFDMLVFENITFLTLIGVFEFDLHFPSNIFHSDLQHLLFLVSQRLMWQWMASWIFNHFKCEMSTQNGQPMTHDGLWTNSRKHDELCSSKICDISILSKIQNYTWLTKFVTWYIKPDSLYQIIHSKHGFFFFKKMNKI